MVDERFAPDPLRDAQHVLLLARDVLTSGIATPRELADAAADAVTAALDLHDLRYDADAVDADLLPPLLWSVGTAPFRVEGALEHLVVLTAWVRLDRVGWPDTDRTLWPDEALAFARLLIARDGAAAALDPEAGVLELLDLAEAEADALAQASSVETSPVVATATEVL